jgi:phosphate transport system substrate-binding protein
LAFLATATEAREQIRIVGSSAALGFVETVAQQFVSHWGGVKPSVEVTGAGAGFELFCAGVGFEHPDIVTTSRRMTDTERALCARNGITEITEIEFGRDAVVLAHAGREPRIDLTLGQLFAALAAQTVTSGGLRSNTNDLWSEVDPALPAVEILVMTPEPNSGAAFTFQEMALMEGCKAHPGTRGLQQQEIDVACRSIRRDGHVEDALQREDKVVAWLQENDHGYALTDYSTYQDYAHLIVVNPIESVMPSEATIGNRRYPLVTGLYMYVKDRHVKPIPALQQFVYELTSERALAPEGYLAQQGLVALDDRGRNRARDAALKLGM